MPPLPLRRSLLPVLIALAGSAALAGPAAAVTPSVAISSGGKLQTITVGNELSCQVAYQGDSDFEFYPPEATPGDCGTFVSVKDTSTRGFSLFGPDFPNHSDTSGGTSETDVTAPLTPVAQSAVSGAGTSASPLTLTSTAKTATASNVQVKQVDSYVTTAQAYRSDITVTNMSTATRAGTVFHAADCYLGGSDSGYGYLDTTSPACTINAANNPADRVEEFYAITGGNRYMESDAYRDVFAAVGANLLTNAVDANDAGDNGMAISWDYSLAPGASATFSMFTIISPNGVTGPVEFDPPTSLSSQAVGGCANNGVPVTVTDTAGGSGAAAVDYSIDGAAPVRIPTTGQPGTATIPVPEGTHSLEYYGEDRDGNLESPHHTLTVIVDHAAPVIAFPAPNTTSFFQGQVAKINVTATDASGLAVNPAPTVSLDTSRTGSFVKQVTATDGCGNTATQPYAYKVTSAATQLGLPSAKACVSRRSFKIHVRKLPGVTFAKVSVKVPGRKAITRKGKKITAPVDLRGLPKGKFKVTITATTTTGQVITGSRTYKTCAPKRKRRL